MTAFEYRIDEATYAGIPGASELMDNLYNLSKELHKNTYDEVIDALVLREKRRHARRCSSFTTRMSILLFYREYNRLPRVSRHGNKGKMLNDVKRVIGAA